MKRIRLLSNPTVVALDKETLKNYSDGAISKQQAMREISWHNGAEDISEEYFDYLVKITGHHRRR